MGALAELKRTNEDFCFVFPDGPKWAKDMTREELLLVIKRLRAEREYQRQAFTDLAQMIR